MQLLSKLILSICYLLGYITLSEGNAQTTMLERLKVVGVESDVDIWKRVKKIKVVKRTESDSDADSHGAKVPPVESFRKPPTAGNKNRQRSLIEPKSRRDTGVGIRAIKRPKGNPDADSHGANVPPVELFRPPTAGIKNRQRSLIEPKSRRDTGMGIRAIKRPKGNPDADSHGAKVAPVESFRPPTAGIKNRQRSLIEPKSRRDTGMGIRAIKPPKGNTRLRSA